MKGGNIDAVDNMGKTPVDYSSGKIKSELQKILLGTI
jgi:hypothetical protein